jgi:DNA-directed RNA polymerase specialized sigma24 family protein
MARPWIARRESDAALFRQSFVREAQSVKFRGGACDRVAAPVAAARTGIRNEIVDRDKRASKSRRPPPSRNRPDARQQFGRSERFRKVIVRTGLEAAHLVAILSLQQREVILLRFREEPPLQDIATITQAPLSTVKARLYRALSMLRTRILARTGG